MYVVQPNLRLFLLKKSSIIYHFIFLFIEIAARPQNGVKKPKALLLSSSQIHGLHTRLNLLRKQSNRGSGGELAIQSCELIETEIG